jgi:hypothetical protein
MSQKNVNDKISELKNEKRKIIIQRLGLYNHPGEESETNYRSDGLSQKEKKLVDRLTDILGSPDINEVEVTEHELEQLEKLLNDIDKLQQNEFNAEKDAINLSSPPQPGIVQALNMLGILIFIGSVFLGLPYLGNNLLGYIGLQIIINGGVSAIILIAIGKIIQILHNILNKIK